MGLKSPFSAPPHHVGPWDFSPIPPRHQIPKSNTRKPLASSKVFRDKKMVCLAGVEPTTFSSGG